MYSVFMCSIDYIKRPCFALCVCLQVTLTERNKARAAAMSQRMAAAGQATGSPVQQLVEVQAVSRMA